MKKLLITLTLFLGIFFLLPKTAEAHCDTMTGPVVTAARNAVNKGNLNLVLIWIKKEDEEELEKAFEKAQKVRKLGKDAEDLADRYFYETLVRLHRKGEGAPYNGLKEKADIPPVVDAVDKAYITGDIGPAMTFIPEEKRDELRSDFTESYAMRNFDENDVEKGRKYIDSYIVFVHKALHASQA